MKITGNNNKMNLKIKFETKMREVTQYYQLSGLFVAFKIQFFNCSKNFLASFSRYCY